jgi:hypothetical protein
MNNLCHSGVHKMIDAFDFDAVARRIVNDLKAVE